MTDISYEHGHEIWLLGKDSCVLQTKEFALNTDDETWNFLTELYPERRARKDAILYHLCSELNIRFGNVHIAHLIDGSFSQARTPSLRSKQLLEFLNDIAIALGEHCRPLAAAVALGREMDKQRHLFETRNFHSPNGTKLYRVVLMSAAHIRIVERAQRFCKIQRESQQQLKHPSTQEIAAIEYLQCQPLLVPRQRSHRARQSVHVAGQVSPSAKVIVTTILEARQVVNNAGCTSSAKTLMSYGEPPSLSVPARDHSQYTKSEATTRRPFCVNYKYRRK